MPPQITEWSAALMTSLAAAMSLFFSATPKIIGFVVILVAGWFIASFVDKGVAALLRAVRFNEPANHAGPGVFIEKMGMNPVPPGCWDWW